MKIYNAISKPSNGKRVTDNSTLTTINKDSVSIRNLGTCIVLTETLFVILHLETELLKPES